jgi:sister chromatid cohesion protein DCC1
LLGPAGVDELPKDGVRAIASCAATLELFTANESALPYLRKLLPVYSNQESLETVLSDPVYSRFSTVSNDIPLSHSEIEGAWTQICAFQDGSKCFRPTAGSLLEAWKAIMAASIAESIPVESSFLVEDLWRAVEDAEIPRGLFNAVLERIADKDIIKNDNNSKCKTVKIFQVSPHSRQRGQDAKKL